ncbi:ferredoxin--NADP reductase [Rhodococcus opacus]|uniref:3-ketosteroid-9-alpha-hydroxylase n=1 Tax=Rhodococcus opacus TaxID=37919 RepID=A0A076EYP3_RHOOP|nr:ferredoxin--NADP reductase [Rhodococcus opacus]AII10906.1 3-ketosteroid-9-alpha-hydroxylase [Rhodococcus opacus]
MTDVISSSRKTHTLTIAGIVDETPDAKSLIFSVPNEARETFTYLPGQFLTLQIPSERSGSVARCYSLSSSPIVDSNLMVTIKRTAGGYGSNWLCDNAAEGMQLNVLPPSGIFTPGSLDSDFLLIAGGSGITPVISIAKTVLSAGTGNVVLFYANRAAESVIFAREVDELSQRSPGRLSVKHWLESERGVPTSELLATEFAAAGIEREAFICGPGPFKDAAVSALRALGYDKSQIHLEIFNSLSGNPFDTSASLASSDSIPGTTVSAEITIGGDVHNIEWPIDVPLVQHLLNRGIDVPFSCQEGECGTCLATVNRGKARMLTNFVLDDDDITSGSILACQALPDCDDMIRIDFDA